MRKKIPAAGAIPPRVARIVASRYARTALASALVPFLLRENTSKTRSARPSTRAADSGAGCRGPAKSRLEEHSIWCVCPQRPC